MFSLSNFVTVIEMLVAELIFIYSFPKRKYFWVRLSLSLAVCLSVSGFIPALVNTDSEFLNSLYTFFRFACLFVLSVGVMGISFKASFTPIMSACAAGYAVQHASSRFSIIIGKLFPAIYEWIGLTRSYNIIILELMLFPFTYVLAYFIFGRLVAKRQIYKDDNPVFNYISVIMVVVCIGFSRFPANMGKPAFAIALCVFALLVQITLHSVTTLQKENGIMKSVLSETRKHYEMSKENIDLINIKCHDLKYKLLALGERLSQDEINSMLECINIYDKTYRTGNDALDTILADKSLKYQKEGIEFTFMGNGQELSFMSVSDIYSLFGNALDNAFEAVRNIEDKDKRIITLTIEKRGELIAVNVTNYFDGQIVFADDGIPVTSKTDDKGYHGFGIKSIKLITEKYKGEMAISVNGDTFTLSIGFSV